MAVVCERQRAAFQPVDMLAPVQPHCLPYSAGHISPHLMVPRPLLQAQAAIREMYGSAHMALLRAAGLVPKLLLVALCMELRATKKPEATVAVRAPLTAS